MRVFSLLAALPLAFVPVAAQAQDDGRDRILSQLEQLQAQISGLRAELIKMNEAQNARFQQQTPAPETAVTAQEAAVAAPSTPQKNASRWTGVYGGLNGGYEKGSYSDSLNCGDFTVGAVSVMAGTGLASRCEGNMVAVSGFATDGDATGWQSAPGMGQSKGAIAGIRLGYNHELGHFVLGIETSFAFSGAHGGGHVLLTQGEFSNNFYEIRHKVDWTNRTVAKVGYLLTDKILLSSNGGMAFVHSSLASSAGYSSSDTRMGWTVGAEVEYMLTDKLGVTASYNHKSIKDLTYEGSSLFGLIDNFHQYDLKMNSFSTGVNYHF